MNIIKAFALTLALYGLSSTVKAGPILVGSGAGEAEFSVTFAYLNFQDLIDECIAIRCELNSPEISLLKSLKQMTLPQPLFTNETHLPGELYEVRGSEVHINQDRLWMDEQKTIGFDLSQGLLLWLEVAHSQPLPRKLAQEINSVFRKNIRRGHVDFENSRFDFLLFTNQKGTSSLQIIDPSLQVVSVADEIRAQLTCADDFTEKMALMAPVFRAPLQSGNVLRMTFLVEYHCGFSTQRYSGEFFIKLIKENDENIYFDLPTKQTLLEGI